MDATRFPPTLKSVTCAATCLHWIMYCLFNGNTGTELHYGDVKSGAAYFSARERA